MDNATQTRSIPLLFLLLAVLVASGGCEGEGTDTLMMPDTGERDTASNSDEDTDEDTETQFETDSDTGDTDSDSETSGDTETDTGLPPGDPNDRYWVGGSGDWSDTAHWSDQPGGPGGASAPDNGSFVTIVGDVTVTLPPTAAVAGLLCDGATLDAADEVELAVGADGLDIATCSLPTGGGYLLGVRFTADGVLDHIQGSVGGTSLAYVDADGHTVTLRPVGDDAPGRDLNVHYIDLGVGGTIEVGCTRSTPECPSNTKVEVQTNARFGCAAPDILGSGTIVAGLEHENLSACSPALLATNYTFLGSIYDVTGGGGSGNGIPREFAFQPGSLALSGPMVLEKVITVFFDGLNLTSANMLRIGSDQNFGVATAVLEGATIRVDYVRFDDSDGAVIDFTGGGTLTADGSAGSHGTDLYVAASGTDGGNNCQQQGSPCASVTRCIEAASALAAPARCLLNRGDTFDETGTLPTVTSSLWFGAYGSGATPEITVDDGTQLIATGDSRIYEQIWRAP